MAQATESEAPLTAMAFEVLLALADGERHGYSILQDIAARTGRPALPGSLYRALHRLLADGWVSEVAVDAADDDRRRVFRLTPLGRRVAEAEARRLAEQVALARRRGILRARRGEETR